VDVGHALIDSGSVSVTHLCVTSRPVCPIRAAVRSHDLPFTSIILYRFATLLRIMPLVEGLEERSFGHSTFMVYARDANILQPNETQRNTLIVAGVYILVIGILWYVLSSDPLQRYLCDT
jgi:hypothetical protein